MKRHIVSITLAALLFIGTVLPVQAQDPCIEEIVSAVNAFLVSGFTLVTGSLSSGTFVTVPTAANLEVQKTLIAAAQQAGMKVTTIEEFVAWLEHAGFQVSRGDADATMYQRPGNWSKSDGCGPMPPGAPSSGGKIGFNPSTDPMSGKGWLLSLLLLLLLGSTGGLLVLRRKPAFVPAVNK